DSSRIVTRTTDGMARLFHPSTGEQLGDAFTGETYAEITHVALSPDGRFLAGACDDLVVRVWSLPS
ncbi:hypothetical protein ACFQ1S_41475, partial [Kibdelosporangium lantanae]